MGKSKPPSAPALPAPPADPNANDQAKAAAGEAATNAKRRTLASASEGSFGRSTDALGSGPSNAPTLKPTLGA
jgi:hypothetical protein